MWDGLVPDGSGCPAGVFPEILRIRAGDPVFGSFPTDAQLAKRIADSFSTDCSAGDANCHTYLGGQIQRPDTRVFPEDMWTLVQKSTEPFTPLGVEDLVSGVWSGGFRV